MTHAPSAPQVNTEQIEELVRQFFAATEHEDAPNPADDIFAGADMNSLMAQPMGDEDDEEDPLFTHVTQRAMLHIPVSESEIDDKLQAGP